MKKAPVVYEDAPGSRFLDLRPDGISCLAGIGFTSLQAKDNAPELHYHPHVLEFCLCLRGNLTFETPEREYKFLPGDIFVSSPDQPHRLKNNPKGLKLYSLLFKTLRPGASFLGLDKRESKWLAQSLMHLPKRVFAATPNVKAAFDRLFDLYDHARPSPGRRVRMKAAALELLVSIVDAARRVPTKSPAKIDAIAARIRKSPEYDYRIDDMAREAGLSVSAFSDVFKKSMGLPPHAYVINSRILKARQLLGNTDLPVASIAAQLRFCSKAHFETTFKRIVGLTPHALRKSRSHGRSSATLNGSCRHGPRPARKNRQRRPSPPSANGRSRKASQPSPHSQAPQT